MKLLATSQSVKKSCPLDSTRYLGVTLDRRLSWSPHIDQTRRRTAQRMGMLGPVLNRKSDLSIKPSQPSQAKMLTGGGDLREAQVDVPLSVSHSCV